MYDILDKEYFSNITDSRNVTCFAYGGINSGKTFTIMGNGENPGLAPRLFVEIFKKIPFLKNYQFTISLNYIEVYNEIITDLLSESSNSVDVKNEAIKGGSLIGVQETFVKNVEEAFHYLT